MRGRAMYCVESECGAPCRDPDPLVWICAREDGYWTCDDCARVNARLEDARGDALDGEAVRPIRREAAA
ncbi:MAG: hypothetical protein OXC31_19915 [Spirochaetaceae bacterium]|nr:hypothetical protein [Spirochaetaceae bacterium]